MNKEDTFSRVLNFENAINQENCALRLISSRVYFDRILIRSLIQKIFDVGDEKLR